MQFSYNNKTYDIVVEKKRGNRNTYIRVKKDLKIHVTTGYFTPIRMIENLISTNYDKIGGMIDIQETKARNNQGFFYLGKQFTIVYCDSSKVEFQGDRVYVPQDFDMDSWYKKEAKKLFLERLNYNYEKYTRHIPYPKLRIRKMTSRWGVCNTQSHVITLNLELMKRDICYLDYVIIHEMTHLVYGDHSARFWKVVEENMPEYAKYRDEMKEF
ncbi:MAG: DUF45 domain-containing protein [Bacilli bacterium]|nr:DUF45 domain-containing protein [Bacilli bacterium]